MKRFITTIATAVTLAIAVPAVADTHKGPEGSNTEVYTPPGWPIEAAQEGSNAILLAADPRDKAVLLYVLVEAKNVKAALGVIDTIVGKLVVDLKLAKGKAVTVGGMKGLALAATGKVADGGQAATLRLIAVQPNAGHVLFAIAMVHTDAAADYAAEFKQALAGIKRVD